MCFKWKLRLPAEKKVAMWECFFLAYCELCMLLFEVSSLMWVVIEDKARQFFFLVIVYLFVLS